MAFSSFNLGLYMYRGMVLYDYYAPAPNMRGH